VDQYLDRYGGWAVLTAERRLKTRPHERLALHRSKIVFFFPTGTSAAHSRAARLVETQPDQTTLTILD
jgi:hypothetical protein